jgi:hypothetical protein
VVKKRMGRPPLPKAELRHHRITLGLNADELAKVAERARAEGLEPSAWAREVLLRALRRGRVK